MSPSKIRVFMIEDQPLFRQAIKKQLLYELKIEWTGEADDGESGIPLIHHSRPEVLILDYYLKKLGGMPLIRRIKKDYPSTKIILLTEEENPFLLLRIIETGVESILTKSHLHPMVEIICHVAKGGYFLEPTLGHAIIQAALEREVILKLNKKEKMYFELTGKKTNHDSIAKELGITISSVKKLLTSTKKKLSLNSKQEIIHLYKKFFLEDTHSTSPNSSSDKEEAQ